jgi:hypothetical protein
MNDDEWVVIVAKFNYEKAKDHIVDVYSELDDLIGVKDLHFIIRDRIDDDVIVSFRISLETSNREETIQYITSHLGTLIPDSTHVINPEPQHPLYEFATWSWKERINQTGYKTFTTFCGYLSQLSRMIVNMAKNGYFDSRKRVEIAHLMSWMLGCTEYGILSTKSWQIGYYDRIAS